jgi:hypothetical protein
MAVGANEGLKLRSIRSEHGAAQIKFMPGRIQALGADRQFGLQSDYRLWQRSNLRLKKLVLGSGNAHRRRCRRQRKRRIELFCLNTSTVAPRRCAETTKFDPAPATADGWSGKTNDLQNPLARSKDTERF